MSFLEDYGDLVSAGVTLLVTFGVAKVIDVSISRRGEAIAKSVSGGDISAVAETRLRLLRRLAIAAIVVIGISLALLQITSVNRFATGLLASSAVAGLVIGLAARQTLANAIAGITLAITQPIRIGDRVTWEGQSCKVEDMRLNYTYLRTDGGSRLIIPNGSLAESSIENHTIVNRASRVEIELWLPLTSNLERARALLEEEVPDCTTEVAELDKEHLRLVVRADTTGPTQTQDLSSELRRRCFARLQAEGMLDGE